jgi:hypothetical protein
MQDQDDFVLVSFRWVTKDMEMTTHSAIVRLL